MVSEESEDLCPACQRMQEEEDARQARPLLYPDGSVNHHIENAAKAFFTFDCGDPDMTWEMLDEADRSFSREGAVAVINGWVGTPS